MSPRPVLPAGKSTRTALAGLGFLAAFKAVALVLLFSALAHALASLAAGERPAVAPLLVQGGIGAVLLGATVWGQQVLARRAALGAKEELRAQLVAHRLSPKGNSGASVGAEGVLASRGLDGLDNYFTAYLPALISCAVLPMLLVIQILVTDWVSALIVVLTVPLVPLFMILIGLHTQDRVKTAARGLDRLSNHLLELARGLPVLVGLRRARAQRQALRDVSETYRQATMGTLRTAFLSSMALELISTISVAVVAVFIGVRLVAGDMSLAPGLLALMLAPECFRPLRDVGAAHHGSEDGVEALRRVNQILEDASTAAPETDDDGTLVVRASRLTVKYGERTEPALADFTLELPRGGTAVLDTPSGTGKSTALAALAGLLHAQTVTGTVRSAPDTRTVWVAQHPLFTEETVSAEVALYAAGPKSVPVGAGIVTAALERVNAAHLAQRQVHECSPGELRRVAVARALARIAADPSVELALIDEPTAHLDPVSAAAVRRALTALQGAVAIVVATHDVELAALLAGHNDRTVVQAASPAVQAPDAQEAGREGSGVVAEPADDVRFRWSWLRRLPLRSPRFAAGVLVSALATLSAAALSGVSGWLIVWAAAQPPMLYLMTLIVGVRFFGISRSVLRYSERLLTHDAVLRWATTLRVQLWDALCGNIRHWGRLTRSGGALGTLVADVDEMRDALPRAVVPIPAAIISFAAILGTVIWLQPQSAVVVWVLGVLALLLLPVAVLFAQRRAAAAAAVHRSWLASRATTLFAAAGQLSANGVGPAQAKNFAAADLRVSAPLRRLAWANGLGQSAVTALTSLAAVAVTGIAVATGADARPAAVAALLMLALAEPLGQYIEAVTQLPVLVAMMKRTMPLLDTPATVVDADVESSETENTAGAEPVTALAVEAITARYPDAPEPVFTGVSGAVSRGHWWTVSGPSGSGKSTLLAVLLGFMAPEAGRYRLNRQEPSGPLLHQVAWCPQESYLFDSTLRANLALARPAATPPTDKELEDALDTVGLGPWYRDLPAGLATRVGPGGHHLSGGQRSRVSAARTLVAGAAVVLLDEPTVHLGQDEAAALVADLRAALRQTAVVLVTHDDELAAAGDSHLRLGAMLEKAASV